MFNLFLNRLVLTGSLVSFSILSSCISTTDRNPTSVKGASEVGFALFPNESLAKKDYTFELIDLSSLQQKKIKFSRYRSDEPDSQKALNEWLIELRTLLPNLQSDI